MGISYANREEVEEEMKIVIKITHGNQVADFQLETAENLTELPGYETFVKDLIEKAYDEFRTTFNAAV